jgi:anti-sigma-K factor RskA
VAEDVRERVAGTLEPDERVAGTLEPDEAPQLDPDAVRRSYHLHRARRRARLEHRRRSRWAGARFWLVLVLLVAACVVLALTTWREIGRLFGL